MYDIKIGKLKRNTNTSEDMFFFCTLFDIICRNQKKDDLDFGFDDIIANSFV